MTSGSGDGGRRESCSTSTGAASFNHSGISAADAIRYTLSQPIDSLVSGIDSLEILATNLEIARNWTPMNDGEQQQLLDLTEPFAGDLGIEHYKKPR